MFDLRPTKLTLRRSFERRTWQSKESFSDYFHDKVILANRVPIDDEELIDYIIDGIPNIRLRDQARVQRFSTKSNLLEAFRGLKLRYDFKTFHEKNDKFNNSKTNKEVVATKSENTPTKSDEAARAARTCYNCKKSGHISKNCRQPKRQTTEPNEEKRSTAQHNTSKEATAATTTSVIQSPLENPPFMIQTKYSISDAFNNMCDYKVMAMIDSGSPVSLIKNNYIPQQAYTPISGNNDSYFGINNTPLTILGSFETDIIVNEISTKIKFLIVPDNTMSFAALLSRDFIASPNIKIAMNKNCTILINDNEIINDTCVETNNLIPQIMHIEYLDKPEITDNVNINPNINFVTKEKLKEIYTETYVAKNNIDTIDSDVEMNIVLKHNQPITFRPRRLSFSDKEKLQKTLDDLLKNNIIRESNSPYASPIVLVMAQEK